jgi:formate dehydrogenase iron-sulfur subunit
MSTKLFVPGDAAARSVGADQVVTALVAEAAARGEAISIVRNGSRGLLWLEPLIEVETPQGRVAYGPVFPEDVPSLFESGFLSGLSHPLGHGLTNAIPYLHKQERLTFARVGLTDPLSLSDYEQHGGLVGLRAALAISPEEIVERVTTSGLRGRGGAAFPTGIKWRTVLQTPAEQKYVVCNADEGDSGTFSDRMLMEGDPFLLIEGMVIAGLATGATRGSIYLRSEYPDAARVLTQALIKAREHGLLGNNILGSGRGFELELYLGAGSYVCGEETALLESLEGKRGVVRYRPPVPAVKGLWGKPTALNNVVTLASVPFILANGPEAYRDYGAGRSRGTLAFQLAGNLKRGGLVERAFGVTLRELLYDYGGGSASGRPLRAVQVGGPLGAFIPASQFDLPLDYEAFAAQGSIVGHGGIVAFDDTVDMAKMARYALEFCAIESCGKCTPCRIGSTRGVELLDRLRAGERPKQQLTVLNDLLHTMEHASLCALGGMTPYPVRSALTHFAADFGVESSVEK